MIDIYEASGSIFFKKTGELVDVSSELFIRSLFCYSKPDYWYWYRANGKCYRMSEANIPAAVKMAVLLMEDL